MSPCRKRPASPHRPPPRGSRWLTGRRPPQPSGFVSVSLRGLQRAASVLDSPARAATLRAALRRACPRGEPVAVAKRPGVLRLWTWGKAPLRAAAPEGAARRTLNQRQGFWPRAALAAPAGPLAGTAPAPCRRTHRVARFLLAFPCVEARWTSRRASPQAGTTPKLAAACPRCPPTPHRQRAATEWWAWRSSDGPGFGRDSRAAWAAGATSRPPHLGHVWLPESRAPNRCLAQGPAPRWRAGWCAALPFASTPLPLRPSRTAPGPTRKRAPTWRRPASRQPSPRGDW
mmetsp:Transcript_540/g.2128  ORF Transcript_540/g.2128 Transcript_540/m.2128 type:complete len:287 (-) Transcript_540:2180-3040(-)